jgi:hypothetical protein
MPQTAPAYLGGQGSAFTRAGARVGGRQARDARAAVRGRGGRRGAGARRPPAGARAGADVKNGRARGVGAGGGRGVRRGAGYALDRGGGRERGLGEGRRPGAAGCPRADSRGGGRRARGRGGAAAVGGRGGRGRRGRLPLLLPPLAGRPPWAPAVFGGAERQARRPGAQQRRARAQLAESICSAVPQARARGWGPGAQQGFQGLMWAQHRRRRRGVEGAAGPGGAWAPRTRGRAGRQAEGHVLPAGLPRRFHCRAWARQGPAGARARRAAAPAKTSYQAGSRPRRPRGRSGRAPQAAARARGGLTRRS